MHIPNNLQKSRRAFIRNISFATAFLLNGSRQQLSANDLFDLRKKITLRFAVASDAHYGQPKTPFDAMIETAVTQINSFHQSNPLDFIVINGDIIHNEKNLLVPAKEKLKELSMPWYVTRGNHDMVSDIFWKEVWNTPLNHEVMIKGHALILADSSNEKGSYLSPDLKWLESALDKHQKRKHVFLFLHIPQAKWTVNGIDTPAFFDLIDRYPNIKAVFHGHEHDQDGIKMHRNIPFLFDAHIGGNWGTAYQGFRVVEMMHDGMMVTYMMNPSEKLKEEKL